MGYNRSGVRRTKRLKRARHHEARLAKKAEAQATAEGGAAPAEPKGILGRVKQAAAGVAHAVGAAVHAVAGTLTGKKETTPPPNG